MRIRFGRILCATDLSECSNRALPYAAALAKKLGGKLSVCNVVDLRSFGLYDLPQFTLPVTPEELASQAVEGLRRAMAGESVSWEPLIMHGAPDAGIVDGARKIQADLIVLASHGRSGVSRAILGSVADKVLRTAPCPVLVVRSPEEDGSAASSVSIEHSAGIHFRKILIGCDFSPDSRLALEYGISLAEEFQSEIHLVHVIEPSVYRSLDRATKSLADDLERAVREVVEKQLLHLVPEDVSNLCKISASLRAGAPDEELASYARTEEIDLIVVGMRGRNLFERLLVGSTADHLLRSACSPILVVRPADRPDQKTGG
jgi:nucleotide-binding universal stress UspA family protein